MNLEHIFDITDPLKQETPLVNLLKETIDRMPVTYTPTLHDFFRRVSLHFNKDTGDTFERIGGQLYIRPSVFFDITGKNVFDIDLSLRAKQIFILGKEVCLRDNHINGYGVLLIAKAGGLPKNAIDNLFEAYTEKDAELRTFVRRFHSTIENDAEEQVAFKSFCETLGSHLNEIANDIKEGRGGKKLTPDAIYYDIMSSGFAEYLIPTDETLTKIKYSSGRFFPSLSENYVHDFISTSINFTDCAERLYGEIENVMPFNEIFGSYCFSILKNERRATPLVLAILRLKSWLTPNQYTVAIADIKHYYELRPAGDVGTENNLY